MGVTRWFSITCYKELHEFSELPLDVNYFYCSTDYLVEIKDELEEAIYEYLRNLYNTEHDQNLTDLEELSSFPNR